MDQEFKYEIHKDSVGDNIRFYGVIDSHSEHQFEELVHKITGRKVIMDFSNTGRINSMGIAMLLCTIRNIKAEKKAEVQVIGENKTNSLLFRITGIYTLTSQYVQD
jgi:anti-anti-sigma regulatory factor